MGRLASAVVQVNYRMDGKWFGLGKKVKCVINQRLG